jgi:hypothetical protein
MKRKSWNDRIKTSMKMMIIIIIIGIGAYMVFGSLYEESNGWSSDSMDLLIDALDKYEPQEPPYIEDIWIRIQNRKVGV